MDIKKPLIETLINYHFCIYKSNIEDIIDNLDISFSEEISFDNTFDWAFLFGEEDGQDQKRFLLFDKINDWNYLRWNVQSFDENKQMALALSQKLNTKVYYFFIDPWIFTCEWVIAENGKLIKSFFESHDKVFEDEGYLDIETEIRAKLREAGKNEFWEDKFWELYDKICQPIEIMNSRENIPAIKGELR